MTAKLYAGLSETARHRLGVASRLLAAIVAGYVLAAAIRLLLVLTLPLSHEPPFNDATQGADVLIWGIHAAILLWVFHTATATRAWLWLIGWTAAVYGLCWLLIHVGGAVA